MTSRTPIRDALRSTTVNIPLQVSGWVRTRRDSKGGFSFIELNDGSCFSNLQIIADATLSNYTDEIAHLHPGASITATGTLRQSPGAGQPCELHAESIDVLGTCDITQYPLQKQRVSFEKLREAAHLRARTNTFGAVARVRNTLSFATHEFFQARQFYYVNTPIITTNDCEGAGQMFRVTTLDLSVPHLQADHDSDFFGQPANLTVSGQLEAETYACALSNVYTFGPTFRAENSNTSRHLAEFWMVEPEMAFADLATDANLAEAYIKFLFNAVLDRCHDDMAFFDARIATGLLATLQEIADSDFERISYCDAIARLETAPVTFEFPVSWGMDLQAEHERYLCEECVKRPVIVTDFPKDIKPFYMRLNDDERTVAAMDVLLPRVGELIGGSQREERLDVLTHRMREQGLSTDDYWWYLDLRRFGTVPHAGFGLGFERVVQFCTGMANIRDVIPFPRTPRNAQF